MSWLEKIENIEFKIKTGEGSVFTPLLINTETEVEFNATRFDPINVDGEIIDRKKSKANHYPLTFFFQGDDHLDTGKAFKKAARDSRAWTVTHPDYGVINGQPLSLKQNNANLGVSEFSVDFWESLKEDYPNDTVSPVDAIRGKVNNVNTLAASSYESLASPTTADVPTIKRNVADVGSKSNRLLTAENATNFQNSVSRALRSADAVFASPDDTIRNNQSLINLPATFDSPVTDRIDALILAYEDIKGVLNSGSKNDKRYYESMGASLVAGIALAASTPQVNDYLTRDQIARVVDVLTGNYRDYIDTINEAQLSEYDIQNSWTPNVQIQQAVRAVVMETTNSLYAIAFGAKQEREIELEKDSNLIVLAHRFMGLDVKDENIKVFREINKIGNDELLLIRKGRKIKYFV